MAVHDVAHVFLRMTVPLYRERGGAFTDCALRSGSLHSERQADRQERAGVRQAEGCNLYVGGRRGGIKTQGLTAAILLAERLAACPDTRKACRYPALGQKRPLLFRQKTRRQPPGAFFRNRLLYIHADPPAACPQKAGDVCGGM